MSWVRIPPGRKRSVAQLVERMFNPVISPYYVPTAICKDGRMSAGCYTTGTNYPQGVFHQSRGGVWEKEDIYAILPIENEYVDLKSFVN